MRRRFFSALTAGSIALTLACSRDSAAPAAPTPQPTPVPNLVSVWVGSGSQITDVGVSRQLHAFAKFSDGSITEVTDQAKWQSSNTAVATISTSGLLTASTEGDVEIRAAYAGMEGAWTILVRQPGRTGPPAADEVIGRIHEVAPREYVNVPYARVEIVGDGRFVTADGSGEFRLGGIQAAGFDLLITKSGYRAGRYRVHELPRDAIARIALEPDSAVVSDGFEGNLCAKNPSSTSFTPHASGLFRITSYKVALFETLPMKLLANGSNVSPTIFVQEGYSVQAGTTYEFRVSGFTEYPSCTGAAGGFDGSFRITYLRPR